ncbi:MAG: hypothetical protein IAI50_18960 [Candidatus Eremiobacteraeota bacterium]|nr:hypothetical protein [Candidatus Eremiobacteraeota bacterium]
MSRYIGSMLAVLALVMLSLRPLRAIAQDMAPSPTASVAPNALAASPFVDFYMLTRPGADAVQTLTLRLRADGIASLRTDYSIAQTAAGTPVTPVFETGRWRETNGIATVHFDSIADLVGKIPTNIRPTSIDLSFALRGCSLSLTADPTRAYGTAGLNFAKKSCSN